MAEVALTAFATLFVTIDPLGNMPIFVTLTQGVPGRRRRMMALKGMLVAAAVFLCFAWFGTWLLALLGIGFPAFRIAGGLMLMWIAFEMVFEKRGPRKTKAAEEIASAEPAHDISVFPIAIPLTAGPGALTSMLLLLGRFGEDGTLRAVVMLTLGAVLAVSLLLFLLADRIERLLGDTLITVTTRLLGILLAALSVQYVIDGVREAIG